MLRSWETRGENNVKLTHQAQWPEKEERVGKTVEGGHEWHLLWCRNCSWPPLELEKCTRRVRLSRPPKIDGGRAQALRAGTPSSPPASEWCSVDSIIHGLKFREKLMPGTQRCSPRRLNQVTSPKISKISPGSRNRFFRVLIMVCFDFLWLYSIFFLGYEVGCILLEPRQMCSEWISCDCRYCLWCLLVQIFITILLK